MNKGNLNKLVTNYPVELTEEEISNLSGTLAPVIAACGGGGGGTGGKIYTGIGFVSVNNSTNQIGLTEAANTKLNQDIPNKVSDLSDSANYQTVAGMDEYLTTGDAQNTYLSKSDAESNYAPIGTYTDVQTLKNQIQNVYTKSETSASDELSAEFASLSAKYQEKGSYASQQSVQTLTLQVQNKQDKLTYGYDENNAISSIDGTPLAGQGGTTYSAGQYINIDANDTISVTGVLALDEYAQYEPVLIGDSNITATSSKVDSHTQWNLRINATPVTTDTTLKGENVVTAHTTQVSGEWAVGLVQSAYEAIDSVGGIATDVGTLKTASAGWDKVSDKLDTTAFSTVSGTFLTKSSADNDYAPISITSTVNTLTGASAGWNEVSAKLGTAQYALDSASFLTGVVTGAGLSGTGISNSPLGIDTTASINLTNASAKSAASAYHAQMFTYNNTMAAISTYAELAEIAIDSLHADEPGYREEELDEPPLIAEYAASAYLGPNTYLGFDKFVTSGDYISGNFQYALTTAGWEEVQGGTTFTGVTTASPITGDGLNNTLGLDSNYKTAIEQVSGKVDKPADMTSNTPYCFSAGQWADLTQTYYSKTEATGTFLQKNLTNTLSGDGTSNNTLGVNWSNLSSNLINSANTASNAWISGTEFSSFAQIKTAIDSKQSAGDYLYTSGGTVSGQLVVSGGSNFDTENLKFIRFIRSGLNGYGRIGLASNGAFAVKVDDSNSNTTQINVAANASYNELIQVQHGGTTAYLIPAVTATTTDGLTNDGILHIILES